MIRAAAATDTPNSAHEGVRAGCIRVTGCCRPTARAAVLMTTTNRAGAALSAAVRRSAPGNRERSVVAFVMCQRQRASASALDDDLTVDLAESDGAGLTHDSGQLAAQDVEYGFDTRLAERRQPPDLRTPDAHRSRAQR